MNYGWMNVSMDGLMDGWMGDRQYYSSGHSTQYYTWRMPENYRNDTSASGPKWTNGKILEQDFTTKDLTNLEIFLLRHGKNRDDSTNEVWKQSH